MFDYHISYDDGVTIAQDKGGRLPTVEEIRDAIVRRLSKEETEEDSVLQVV